MTVLAVPLYAGAAGVIPIVEALLDKGLPLGTVLAFMMATVVISLPEFLILRRFARLPLLAIFLGWWSAASSRSAISSTPSVCDARSIERRTLTVKIEVLGSGCANCKAGEANAREAVGMAGVEAET